MIHDANMMSPTATAATPLASNSSGGRKKQRRFTYRKHSQTAATSAIHFSAADASNVPLTSTKPFLALVTLLALALTIQFAIVFSWHHKRHDVHVLGIHNNGNVVHENVGDLIYVPNNNDNDSGDKSHLEPHIPHMPPIINVHRIPDPMKLKEETLSGHKPTVAGVAIIISSFLTELHRSNEGLAIKAKATGVSQDEVHQA